MEGARPAASVNAVSRSALALSDTALFTWVVPLTVPFPAPPKPVTAVPGLNPRSPLTTDGPVFVTVEPARTPNGSAVPSPTDGCAANPAAGNAQLATAAALTNRRTQLGRNMHTVFRMAKRIEDSTDDCTRQTTGL